MTAVQKNSEVPAVPPEGGSAQLPPTGGQDLAELVRFAVESPQLLACLGIQGCDAVIGCRDVKDAIDHQWRGLEKARCRSVLRERRFPMLPLPCHFQLGMLLGLMSVSCEYLVPAGSPPW